MFTKLKLTFATAIVLVGGVAGLAAAQGPHQDKQAIKARFDLDQDGTLDDAERARMKAELGAMRAQHKARRLAKFDANKNGALDPAEQQAMHDEQAATKFAKLDTNKDGKLTLDEFKAGTHGHGMRHGRRGMGRGRP